MLERQQAVGQRRRGVVGQDRHPDLTDHGSAVQVGGHEMHAGAVLGLAGIEHPLMRVQARVAR